MYLILLLTTRGPAHTKSCTAGVPKPRLASIHGPAALRCRLKLPPRTFHQQHDCSSRPLPAPQPPVKLALDAPRTLHPATASWNPLPLGWLLYQLTATPQNSKAARTTAPAPGRPTPAPSREHSGPVGGGRGVLHALHGDCRPLGQPSSLHILRLSFSPTRIWTLRTRNNILWKLIKHS